MAVYSEQENWTADLKEGDFKKNFEEDDIVVSPALDGDDYVVHQIRFEDQEYIHYLGSFKEKEEALIFARAKNDDDDVNIKSDFDIEFEVLKLGQKTGNERVYTEEFFENLEGSSSVPLTMGFDGPEIGTVTGFDFDGKSLTAKIEVEDEAILNEILSRNSLQASVLGHFEEKGSRKILSDGEFSSFKVKDNE